jgi:probable rRNA maturation factor
VKRASRAHIVVRSPRIRGISKADLRAAVELVFATASPQTAGDVSVVVVSDQTMRGLNRRYRGFDRPTDVLAFPLAQTAQGGEPFGDIVIAHETARRQAREYGGSFASEMRRLAVHGALHLCGYDHHERRQAARMFGLARKLERELERR